MNQKKGFTLVELITVLVVIAIILAITVPTVTSIINTSYLKTHELDLAALERAGRDYVTKGYVKLAENDLKIVTIGELILVNLTEEVRDPRTKEICDGYVSITKTGNETIYKAKIRCGDYETEEYGSEDPDAPIITILGNNPYLIQRGVIYIDEGATAIDNVDGDLTNSIVATGSVNTGQFGEYAIVYTVKDKIGNIGTATRIVKVVDDVPPEITFSILGNDIYAQSRSTRIDVTDDSPLNANSLKYIWTTSATQPDLLAFTNSYTNNQTISTPASATGDYYLWVYAMDIEGNDQYARTNVFKLDNTPPVITMNGEAEAVIARGSTYVDAGASATDNIDGPVSVNISGTVSANIIGEYQVTYTATDSSGNQATPVVRIVVVRDMTAPEISVLGDNPYNMTLGETYTDPGATALDDVDGDLTSSIQLTSNVNVNIANSYTVTYTVKDSNNNEAVRTRTVNVQGITQYRSRTSTTTQSCQTCYQSCYYGAATPSYWCSSGTLSGSSCVASYGVYSTFSWSFWCNNGSWANAGGSCSGNCGAGCAAGYSGPGGYETGSNCPSGACSSGASTSCTSNWAGTCSMSAPANVGYSCPVAGTYPSGSSCYYSCNPYDCNCVPQTTWGNWSLWQLEPVTPNSTN